MTTRTLWCLNRASDLIGVAHAQDIQKLFGGKLTLGDRTKFSQKSVTDNKYNLMPGCEYFVPDIAKCIAGRFQKMDQYPELTAIYDYYVKKMKQPDYSYYWGDKSQPEVGCYMATPKFTGYYDILEQTAPNILVGYSQGGLVVQYLAYLDHYIFKKKLIDAVVTISAPFAGSPLANPENRANIGEAIFELLSCIQIKIFGKTEEEKGLEKPKGDLLEWVYHTLIWIRNTLEKLCPDQSKELIDMFSNWIDWLGGLNNDPRTAFFDLNIFRMENQSSVLSGANQTVTIPRKALISTDNSLRDILHPQAAKVIHDVFRHQLDRAAKSLPPAEPDVALSSEVPGKDKISIDIDYEKAETIINTKLMKETHQGPITNPLISDRIKAYQNGIPELNIPKYAHDFIIPSAYQVMPNGNPLSDFNQPNPEANHITGGDCKYQAGQKNYQDVVDFLKTFLEKNP